MKICSVKEALLKEPHILWFSLYEISRIGNSTETESRPGLTKSESRGGGVEGLTDDGIRFFGGESNEMSNSLQWYLHNSEYTENYWIVNFKWAICIAYDLYFNKVVFTILRKVGC